MKNLSTVFLVVCRKVLCNLNASIVRVSSLRKSCTFIFMEQTGTKISLSFTFVFVAVVVKCDDGCYRWSLCHPHSNSHCYLEVPYFFFLTPCLSKVLSLLVGFCRACPHHEVLLFLSCQYTKNVPNEIFITYTSRISSLETKDKPIKSTI